MIDTERDVCIVFGLCNGKFIGILCYDVEVGLDCNNLRVIGAEIKLIELAMEGG